MAPSFVACDREQPFLLPPDVRDWLPEDHFAWFVIDAVERIDMAAFYSAYREDGRCRPAYEPAMMLALLLYAYAPEAAQGVKAPARGAAVDGVPGQRGLRGISRARGDEKRQADGAGHEAEAV